MLYQLSYALKPHTTKLAHSPVKIASNQRQSKLLPSLMIAQE
jgi:hypothetical protein